MGTVEHLSLNLQHHISRKLSNNLQPMRDLDGNSPNLGVATKSDLAKFNKFSLHVFLHLVQFDLPQRGSFGQTPRQHLGAQGSSSPGQMWSRRLWTLLIMIDILYVYYCMYITCILHVITVYVYNFYNYIYYIIYIYIHEIKYVSIVSDTYRTL